VFIDWPNDMMTNYLNLPLAEKQDYWRIFGAEAYANGLFPSFHLKDTLNPTAEQYGMLPFFEQYTRFYRDNGRLFVRNHPEDRAVRVASSDVAASVLVQRGTGRRTVHLVNHRYQQGIVPQTGLGVALDLPSCPRRITMYSPDFPERQTLAWTCQRGSTTVTVDRLDYYGVLVVT
jgi:hypothetical protein